MSKQFILSIIAALIMGMAFGQEVNEFTAKAIGNSFLAGTGSANGRAANASLELAYKATAKVVSSAGAAKETPYFYVFNAEGNTGFVIVSGSEKVSPILGYSPTGFFDPESIPDNVAKWLDNYKTEIHYVTENRISATEKISNEWKLLKSGKTKSKSGARTEAIAPLLKTTWNQIPFYNDLCPFDATYNTKVVTGCVATAMAQIMKFWNYPATGTGFYSYNHEKYGTLSANFGNTTYQWASMPNSINSANAAIATLMYHVGVSMDMNYGPAATGGSSAYHSKAASAYKTYFRYPATILEKYRSNFTEATWKAMLKVELDAGRPIQYAGSGSGGGHSFVCDGYDANDFFHFNWGWGGNSDGFFAVGALNPAALGAGGGTGGFNASQSVIIGIAPPPGTNTMLDMRLFSSMVINPSPIISQTPFTVSVDLLNAGTSVAQNFTGDYGAAVFNSSNQFVEFVEIKTGLSLPFGFHYTSPLIFSSQGISAMIPGNYTIGIYYKPAGSTEWSAFANGTFLNFAPVVVQNSMVNPMKLFAGITTNPSPIIKNQSFEVKFDVVNSAATAFNGDISVDLHRADGEWIRELSIITGLSLPAGFHYNNGLTYNITGLNEVPGTYQFFVWSKPNGGEWANVSPGTFNNPINVNLVEPSLPPDPYEANNTLAQATSLPVVFSGNSAIKNTVGSNCHNGADYDYYKVVLPAGSSYTIFPRLHDAYNSTNGNNYTLDALFSYSIDGTNWSEAFDDVAIGDLKMANGGTVYFHVAPYFSGELGTYLLEINFSTAVSKQNQSVTFNALPNKVMGDVAFSLNATASSNLAVTYSSSNPAIAEISGNICTIVGAGTVTITAKQIGNAEYNAATNVNQNLTVAKGSQSITFNALPFKSTTDPSFSLNGTASSGLTVTYTSSNLAVATIEGNTITLKGAGISTITAIQGGNTNFNAAVSVNQTLTVSLKQSQTITFLPISSRNFGDPSFDLSATATSALPITFTSSNTAVATINGKTVSLVGIGSTTITASQAGNASYHPATDVSRTFTVTKTNQSITFSSLPSKLRTDAPFDLTASSSSGLAVSYSSSNTAVATVTGKTVTIVGAGTTTIIASQTGNTAFNAAPDVPQNLTVSKVNQTITFNALLSKSGTDGPFDLTATASSGLPVSYTSSNLAVATISGKTVTLVGQGLTTITASQAGDDVYNVASTVSRDMLVIKGAQTITFAPIPARAFGSGTFSLVATASSGLSVQFTSISDKVSISGSQVTILKTGSVTITATQPGDSRYQAATPVDQTFCINPAKPTVTTSTTGGITLTSSSLESNQWYKDGAPIVGATNSTLSVTLPVPGIYKVQVNSGDCKSEFSSDVPIIITGDLVGGVDGLEFFPNPVHDVLQVKLPWAGSKSIQIIHGDGRAVEKIQTEKQEISIPVSQYSSGQYFLYIRNQEGISTGRFIKK